SPKRVETPGFMAQYFAAWLLLFLAFISSVAVLVLETITITMEDNVVIRAITISSSMRVKDFSFLENMV
ncbi:MAG: hypothetical protein PHQ08_02685, partial [Candidatus Pacebacteria bacterium]|nr:hypothetical protein [Candidatus Paceibacterota bacterium]